MNSEGSEHKLTFERFRKGTEITPARGKEDRGNSKNRNQSMGRVGRGLLFGGLERLGEKGGSGGGETFTRDDELAGGAQEGPSYQVA